MLDLKSFLFFIGLLFSVSLFGQTEGYRFVKENNDFFIEIEKSEYIGAQAFFLNENGAIVSQTTVDNNQLVSLTNLNPATVYTLRLEKLSQPTENWMIISPSESTGEINIFFNVDIAPLTLDIDSDVELDATSGLELLNQTISYIDQAQDQIDVMMYNCSRPEFVTALKNAVDRGVRVRYITEDQSSNFSLNGPLNFEVLRGNDEGLMHNKVIIIDPDREDDSWLFTGSTNFTTNQVGSDPNDFMAIQDQSLARIYEIEFDEMWGGTGLNPNLNQTKFGANKTNNTPKQVILSDGTLIEAYMSPSDETADRIIDALDSAKASIDFGLLLFTHNGLSDAIVDADRRDVAIKGIIDSDDFSGSEYNYLKNLGIDVILDPDDQKIFHHKYVIIDWENEDNGKLCTGSHNWSYSADTRNDENLIVVHNQDVAEIYFAEFIAQRCIMNMDDCISSTSEINNERKKAAKYIGNHRIELNSSHPYKHFAMYDLSGKILSQVEIGSQSIISLPENATGLFLIHFYGQDSMEVLKVFLG